MKNKKRLGLLICLLLILSGLNCHGRDNSVPGGEVKQSGLAEYQGRLVKVAIADFGNKPWKELGLEDENGNVLVILIGKKAEELMGKQDRIFRIKGKVKQGMTVKGKKVPVVEINSIQEILK